MRNLLLIVISASACAARAPQTTVLHGQYTCGEVDVMRSGESLATPTHSEAVTRGWSDSEGDHFVTWPVSPVDGEAVEFVVPSDPHRDALRRIYDASKGTSRADWRLVKNEVCTAHGGYSDVLARYVRGESLDQLASDLQLGDRDAARGLVHDAMMSVQRRYYHDR